MDKGIPGQLFSTIICLRGQMRDLKRFSSGENHLVKFPSPENLCWVFLQVSLHEDNRFPEVVGLNFHEFPVCRYRRHQHPWDPDVW